MEENDKKLVVVTGGSRGIGKETVLSLVDEGYRVAFLYSGSEENAGKTLSMAREKSPSSKCYKCDVSDSAKVKATVEEIYKEYSTSVYALVNNAGITRDGLLMRMSDEDWRRVIDVNLTGTFNMTREISRILLRNKGGRIINISSVSGIIGNAGQANYASSKAGIIGLTKTAAREFATKGITVNAIAPGFIETEMTENLDKGEVEKLIPLKRMGKASDIAKAVLFLLSADYITGSVLKVDGGIAL